MSTEGLAPSGGCKDEHVIFSDPQSSDYTEANGLTGQ